MARQTRRPSRSVWKQLREVVWRRDQGFCQGPYCYGAPPLALEQAHIDHRVPLSRSGTNELVNLRTLCRRCHVLRAGHEHRGMIATALRDGIIPADWRQFVWDDDQLKVSVDDSP
jgi:5-methylcytosine-specific restriction protein A